MTHSCNAISAELECQTFFDNLYNNISWNKIHELPSAQAVNMIIVVRLYYVRQDASSRKQIKTLSNL